jgi:hypothetical protein
MLFVGDEVPREHRRALVLLQVRGGETCTLSCLHEEKSVPTFLTHSSFLPVPPP